jgi:hypothetical protein
MSKVKLNRVCWTYDGKGVLSLKCHPKIVCETCGGHGYIKIKSKKSEKAVITNCQFTEED